MDIKNENKLESTKKIGSKKENRMKERMKIERNT